MLFPPMLYSAGFSHKQARMDFPSLGKILRRSAQGVWRPAAQACHPSFSASSIVPRQCTCAPCLQMLRQQSLSPIFLKIIHNKNILCIIIATVILLFKKRVIFILCWQIWKRKICFLSQWESTAFRYGSSVKTQLSP